MKTDYIIFAFGDYKDNSKAFDILIETVSQISNTDVKFQSGDSGAIITFGTELVFGEVSDFVEKNIVKLTAMYFLFPIDFAMSFHMEDKMKEHLFGNTDNLTEDKQYKSINSDSTGMPEFFTSTNTNRTRSFDDFFKLFFEEIIQEEPQMSLEIGRAHV